MNRVANNQYNFYSYLDEINKELERKGFNYTLRIGFFQNSYWIEKEFKNGLHHAFEPGGEKSLYEMSEYLDGLYRGFQLFGGN